METDFDVKAECHFCFFFEKVDRKRGARLVRHWYEKDKILPVNPARISKVDEDRARIYPPGYRYLAYFQEETMEVKVLMDMPGLRRHIGTDNLEKHDMLYWQAKSWIEEGKLDV